MSISRYRNVNIIDGKYYESSDFPSKKELDAIPTFSIVISQFERLDILASKHLGDGTYWWVIAVLNDINWPFGFEAGQIIKIPINVEDVLRLF